MMKNKEGSTLMTSVLIVEDSPGALVAKGTALS